MRSTLLLALSGAALLVPAAASAQSSSPFVPYVMTVANYAQNFNTLASSGTSNLLPAGFQIVETNGTGSNANGSYTAGTGSSNTGDAYSFGTTAADRALGSVTSGGLTPITYGGVFTNGLGAAITALNIAYVGEQWRAANATNDKLVFEYSLNATSVSAGTWIAFSALDFAQLITGTSTGSSLDGNLAVNRDANSATISGLNIAAGSNFGFRWTDFDMTGSDQGLAIDDLTIGAVTAVSAVPEPATWAMMLVGFGMTGAAMRYRRRKSNVSFA